MTNQLSILSGADIGASCYLLELCGVRILFDCGVRKGAAYTDHPNIPSLETIDAIFISHAHIDHMGAVAYAAAVCKNADIYMTPLTKDFVRFQLESTIGQYIGAHTKSLKYNNELLCELIMNRIKTINYRDKLSFVSQNGTTCHFSMFYAGHVPGGAMVYLNINGKTVLYTGDFSAFDTSLTHCYSLPTGVRPDTLILCGTHANSPSNTVYSNYVMSSATNGIFDVIANGKTAVIPVSQLTKGLEIIDAVKQMIEDGDLPPCVMYIENDLWELAKYYSVQSDYFSLTDYMRPLYMRESDVPTENPEIILEYANVSKSKYKNYRKIRVDFTLHADYNDLVDLINYTQPRDVYVVHVGKNGSALKDAPLHSALRSLTYTVNEGVYELD